MKIVSQALLMSLAFGLPAAAAVAATGPAGAALVRDGQHDFDWEFGAWTTQLRRLRDPLSGKIDWIDYSGSSVVRPALAARSNLVELDVRGAAGAIAGVSLRLYRPETGEWFLHFANLANGVMSGPMHGSFTDDGLGTFYGEDTLRGRAVLARFLIKPINDKQWRFEQAYSADGGKTWEANWIAVDTRAAAIVAPSKDKP